MLGEDQNYLSPPIIETTFWQKAWFYIRYPMILIAAGIVAAIGIALLKLRPNLNIGGLIGKIVGEKKPNRGSIEIINSVPDDRTVIVGTPDEEGFTQIKQEQLELSHNPLRDKDVIELFTGDKIRLPEGVKDHQVESIVIVTVDNKEVVGVKLKDGEGKLLTKKPLDQLIAEMKAKRSGV